jgi:hypothetical protein
MIKYYKKIVNFNRSVINFCENTKINTKNSNYVQQTIENQFYLIDETNSFSNKLEVRLNSKKL